jgi:hypothetical protein
MGSDDSRSVYEGFLIPDIRISPDTIWAAHSNYDEAEVALGTPEAQQDTDQVIVASGTPTLTTRTEVKTQRGGFAGIDKAGFIWRKENDAATGWRGWDPPHTISAYETVDWQTGGGGRRHPHAVVADDDSIVVAYETTVLGLSHVSIRRRATDGTWSAGSSIYSETTTGATDRLHPCLVRRGTRILCYFFVYDDTNDRFNVRMMYSGDRGVTWATGQTACLDDAGDDLVLGTGNDQFTPRRLRVAFNGSQFLLVFWATEDSSAPNPTNPEILWQWSSDDGAQFSTVVQFLGTNTDTGCYPDIVVSQGRFVVGYCDGDTGDAKVRIIANASQSILTATAITISGQVGATLNGVTKLEEDGDLALVVDEDGTLYAYAREQAADRKVFSFRSYDHGTTWDFMGARSVLGATPLVDMGTADNNPHHFAAVFQRGRVAFCHNATSGGGTADNSLFVAYLGGYTTTVMPSRAAFRRADDRLWWDRTWLPFEDPLSLTWTAADTGAPTRNLTDGYLEMAVAIGETALNHEQITTTVARGYHVEGSVDPNGGEAVIRLRTPGATGYEVELSITDALIQLNDVLCAGTTNDAGLATTIDFKIAIANDEASAWYRASSTDEDREWILLGTLTGMSQNGGAGNEHVRWGCTASLGAQTVRWYRFHATGNRDVAGHMAGGQTNPDDLLPRPYSPNPVYVDDGVRMRAVDGPTYEGDIWYLVRRSAYGIRHVHPRTSPSPSRPWRSATTPADMTIAWDIRGSSADRSHLGRDLMGVWLEGINMRQAQVRLRYGGAWNLLDDVDFSIEVGYRRRGNTIHVTGGTIFGPYLEGMEAAGGTFEFDDAGQTCRKITSHNFGPWIDEPDVGAVPVLYCEDIDGTEPAAGTGRIWFPRALLLFHLAGVNYVEGVQILLHPTAAACPDPPEGYYQIGVAAIGRVEVAGWRPGWAQSYQTTPNVQVETLEDGSRRSRKRGPERDRREILWPQVDISSTRGDTTAPDFVKGTTTVGAVPIATRTDAPLALEAIVRELDGPNTCCAYIPYIPKGSNGANTIVHLYNRARGTIYGRIISPVRRDVIVGTPESDEVVRGSACVIEQEV